MGKLGYSREVFYCLPVASSVGLVVFDVELATTCGCSHRDGICVRAKRRGSGCLELGRRKMAFLWSKGGLCVDSVPNARMVSARRTIAATTTARCRRRR